MRVSVEARFWSKVQKGAGCWEWQAGKHRKGYGQFFPTPYRVVYAHRFAWLLEHGSLREEDFVLHSCDNRACVRPSHLFLGDAATNAEDMAKKGRHLYGTRNGNASLTEEQVRALLTRYREGGVSQRALAAEFGVAQSTVGRALRQETYTNRWL